KERALEAQPHGPLDDVTTDDEGPHSRRVRIAEMVGQAGLTPEMQPLIEWFLNDESDQAIAVELLWGQSGTTAAQRGLALRGASRHHRSARLLTRALEVLADGEVALPDEQLALLCQHHQPRVRDAAQRLAT